MILRAYNSNLRPVVIIFALLSAVWALLSTISAFRTLSADKSQGFPKLGTFAIVLGSIYAGVCGIEVFGIATAALQRLWMARIYAILSVVSAFAVVGSALMRVVIHFILKNDLITECINIAKGDMVYYQFGFWGPTFETKLNEQEATTYCNNNWSHDSFVEIISLIIELLIAAFFSSIAFAYYHQLSDPTSAANVTRAPPAVSRGHDDDESGYPSHYNPPYLSYDAPQYAPPPGPPPEDSEYDDGAKLYGGAKPPMYMQSEDDLGTYGEDKQSKSDPFADFEGNTSRSASRADERPQDSLV